MNGREILHKMKEKACFSIASPASPDTAGKGKHRRHVTHGHHLVEGKSNHAMEDCLVSELKQLDDNDLGLFAIYDGHMGHNVAQYLQTHLFPNILKEMEFWVDPVSAMRKAYNTTDKDILEQSVRLGKGGSTAVTAILINGQKLVVGNVGDSRAVICKKGVAIQLSVDHEPNKEKKIIESKGGFVSNIPGDVPRVDGQLAVARAFGDKSLKRHLSSEPDVVVEIIDDETEFIILASDGLWKVMSNEEAVVSIKSIKDPHSAAKHLALEARTRKSKDDISCIVSVRLGKGGSTAVTAILINGQKLVVGNVGDSRAVICKKGVAIQLSVDHEPNKEKKIIESKGGFVSNIPGDVPRVDGQLAVARAFGDKSLKRHLSSEPDVVVEIIDDETEFIILASDGLWKVMSNEEAVVSIKSIKDPHSAAKHLALEARTRKSKDDISCIVVRFQ